MKINDAIKRLLDLKDEYGEVELVGTDGSPVTSIEPQKFFDVSNLDTEDGHREMEGIHEVHLEEFHLRHEGYQERIHREGICIEIR